MRSVAFRFIYAPLLVFAIVLINGCSTVSGVVGNKQFSGVSCVLDVGQTSQPAFLGPQPPLLGRQPVVRVEGVFTVNKTVNDLYIQYVLLSEDNVALTGDTVLPVSFLGEVSIFSVDGHSKHFNRAIINDRLNISYSMLALRGAHSCKLKAWESNGAKKVAEITVKISSTAPQTSTQNSALTTPLGSSQNESSTFSIPTSTPLPTAVPTPKGFTSQLPSEWIKSGRGNAEMRNEDVLLSSVTNSQGSQICIQKDLVLKQNYSISMTWQIVDPQSNVLIYLGNQTNQGYSEMWLRYYASAPSQGQHWLFTFPRPGDPVNIPTPAIKEAKIEIRKSGSTYEFIVNGVSIGKGEGVDEPAGVREFRICNGNELNGNSAVIYSSIAID